MVQSAYGNFRRDVVLPVAGGAGGQDQGQPAGPAAYKELFVLNKQPDGQWKFTHYSFSKAPAAK